MSGTDIHRARAAKSIGCRQELNRACATRDTVQRGPVAAASPRWEPEMTDASTVDVAIVRQWLADGGEIAFVDVREEGQHNDGHPLLAISIPYSRLELEVGRLVPRRDARVVLADDGDGVAAKAARRMAGLG